MVDTAASQELWSEILPQQHSTILDEKAVSLHFLEGDRLLLYCCEDTDDYKGGTAYVRLFSADGALEDEDTLSLSDSGAGWEILSVRRAGQYIYFIHPRHTVKLHSGYWGLTLLFNNADRTLYSHSLAGSGIWDDQLVLLLSDGTALSALSLREGFTQPGTDTVFAAAHGEDFLCYIPEEAKNTLRVLRPLGAAAAAPVEALEDGTYPEGSVYLFPSGRGFLVMDRQHPQGDSLYHYTFTLYDSDTLTVTERFTLDTEYLLLFSGFSQDETQLIFRGFLLDLNTHRLTALDGGSVYGEHPGYLSSFTHCSPLYSGGTYSAIWNDLADMCHIYREGSFLGSVALSVEQLHLSSAHSEWEDLEVGGSGLILARVYNAYHDTTPSHYLLFSADTLRTLPNGAAASGSPALALGSTRKIAVFADTDNVLRVYDFDRDKLAELSVEADFSDVRWARLVKEDTVLIVQEATTRFAFLDVATGAVLNRVTLPDHSDTADLQVLEEAQYRALYLFDSRGTMSGARVHTDTWNAVFTMEDLVLYLPGQNRVLRRTGGGLEALPTYTAEQLLEQAKKLLEQYA